MQIEQFTKVRNVSIAVTITCALVVLLCYAMDTNANDVHALQGYIYYANQCIENEDIGGQLPESCSMLLRNDLLYKSSPDHMQKTFFTTVKEMEEFVDGYEYVTSVRINPYINAYIKQSLWEYADWCIDEESSDYWHMKYIASQKTGGYSYARQIKYRWYKLGYENAPFIVILSVFIFIFINVLCALYGLNGTIGKPKVVKKIPKWNNDYSDGKSENSEEN